MPVLSPLDCQKTELLARIRRAKAVHIRWRVYAQAFVAGLPVSEDRLPVTHRNCRFGQWYHGEGRALLGNTDAFADIKGPHERLHAVYAQIYGLVRQGKSNEAYRKLEELMSLSRTLVERIGALEAEIEAKPDFTPAVKNRACRTERDSVVLFLDEGYDVRRTKFG